MATQFSNEASTGIKDNAFWESWQCEDCNRPSVEDPILENVPEEPVQEDSNSVGFQSNKDIIAAAPVSNATLTMYCEPDALISTENDDDRREESDEIQDVQEIEDEEQVEELNESLNDVKIKSQNNSDIENQNASSASIDLTGDDDDTPNPLSERQNNKSGSSSRKRKPSTQDVSDVKTPVKKARKSKTSNIPSGQKTLFAMGWVKSPTKSPK